MNFISLRFAAFLITVLVLYQLFRTERQRQLLLLAASYIFYAAGDIRFLFLLIGISASVWYLGLQIQKQKNSGKSGKTPLHIGVAICLVTLGFFKYFNFFIASFAKLLHQDAAGALHIILPLGISFYTFQAISYLADIYYSRMSAEEKLWKVLLYVGFFPQIVSGPIVKARDFFPQLDAEHRITSAQLSYGTQLFLIGLFKKVVIADRLGVSVNVVFSAPMAYSGTSLLVASIAYAIQIYCDFSGYSDMAIAVAHLFGYDLRKNFNMPYIARNPSDFWRRWHISLSSWFRDYVYIPLGGNRKGKVRTYINLFVTMLLSGLWHGAAWTFVIWGALHGIASAIHKVFSDYRKQHPGTKSSNTTNKIKTVASVLCNTALVWLLWIPFRADSLEMAWTIIQRIFTMAAGIQYIYVFTIVFAVLIMGYQLVMSIANHGESIWKPLDLRRFSSQVILLIFILLILTFAYVGDTAFIYAQF